MLEHDELDSLLNGIDWDQPLSPLNLNLPRDPDIPTLLSSSPVSPVASPNRPPNPLVDKFLKILNEYTDPTYRSPCDLTARVTSQNCLHCVVPKLNLLKPNRKIHNLTPLRQDDSALIQQLWEHRLKTLEHLFHDLIDSIEISKFSNRSGRPRYNPYLHYRPTNAFFSWEIVFWDYKRQEYTIQNTVLSSQRLVVPLSAIEVQPVE